MVVSVVGDSLLVEVLFLQFAESTVGYAGDVALVVDVDIEDEIAAMVGLVGNQRIAVAAQSHQTAVVTRRHIRGIERLAEGGLPATEVGGARGRHQVGNG